MAEKTKTKTTASEKKRQASPDQMDFFDKPKKVKQKGKKKQDQVASRIYKSKRGHTYELRRLD